MYTIQPFVKDEGGANKLNDFVSSSLAFSK